MTVENNENQQQKELQENLTRKMIDIIILSFLRAQPMHGYELLIRIRKTFKTPIGVSTVYPIISKLEKKNCIIGQWNSDNTRPRKIYTLTAEGQEALAFAENILNIIQQKRLPLDNTDEL